jgi:hypothetical protein
VYLFDDILKLIQRVLQSRLGLRKPRSVVFQEMKSTNMACDVHVRGLIQQVTVSFFASAQLGDCTDRSASICSIYWEDDSSTRNIYVSAPSCTPENVQDCA